MSWRSSSSALRRSWRRPGPGWPGTCRTSATRLVSLHDPDARPIRKGRIDRPVEFGYKAQVTDNDDGIVLDYAANTVRPRTGRSWRPRSSGSPAVRAVPRAVAADRGYGQPLSNATCTNGRAGRRHPAPGQDLTRPQDNRAQPRFRTLVKWRTGCEGRISDLKRG